ncbi:AbrB/MazE/SpoVT family DNA-binding domain-containing protein [Helicobacter sp. 23-1048]
MTKLVKIGTSYGIRIPKIFIQKAKLQDVEIDLKLLKNGLLLTPHKQPRASWNSENLRKKAMQKKHSTTFQELQNEFLGEDIKEWDW